MRRCRGLVPLRLVPLLGAPTEPTCRRGAPARYAHCTVLLCVCLALHGMITCIPSQVCDTDRSHSARRVAEGMLARGSFGPENPKVCLIRAAILVFVMV